MAYHFDTIKLEKGMYAESGRSFSRVLEELDPGEQYRGTALEGLDAYQRQLKRFDIKVKGALSFTTWPSLASAVSNVALHAPIPSYETFIYLPPQIKNALPSAMLRSRAPYYRGGDTV